MRLTTRLFVFLVLLTLINVGDLYAQCPIMGELIVERCDSNGTPCDPADDFFVLFAQASNRLGTTWGLDLNGTTYGPYPYAPLPSYIGTVPGNQPPLCGTFYEWTRPQCEIEACTGPLTNCSDTFNSINIQLIECFDNRTANDPSDDYYRVTFNGIAPARGWPHQFNVQVDGVQYGPFTYGQLQTIILPADGMVKQVYIGDVRDPRCSNFANVGPLEPCSVPCKLTADLINEECNDNGTPDPTDDYWIITFDAEAETPGPSNVFDLRTQFVPRFPFMYGTGNRIIIPARGQTQTVFLSDTDYDDCNDNFEIGPLDHCSILCEVEVDSVELKCDNKGTPTDADDTYQVCIVVNDTAGGDGYTIRIAGDKYGPFKYDTIQTFELPADGSSPRLVIQDTEFPDFCETFYIIGPLDPCSFPCEFVINSLIPECDDKGTPQTGDDEYNITVNLSYLQGMANDSFYIEMNGDVFGPYAYEEDQTFTYPADGGTYEIIFRDYNLGQFCTIKDTIGPLEPCSSFCELDIRSSNIRCDDGGTPTDPGDDIYFFDLTVDGTNVGSAWEADDPSMTIGNYGNTVTFGPYPISGGNVLITITDVDDMFCRDNIEITVPPSCSDECQIEVIDFTIGPCNDNNTGPNSNDDFFFLNLVVDGINTGPSQTYDVVLNGTPVGTYAYGIQESVGPLPANGTNITIIITDSDRPECETQLTISQDPCSDCTDEADAGSDKLITCQDNEVTLDGSGTSQGTFTWEGPNGRQFNGRNPRVGEPGTYILTVTFAKGCTDIDSVVVMRDNDLPESDPGPDQDLTCVVDTVLIGGPGSSTGPNIIYEWTDVNGNVIANDPTIEITIPGVYCLQVIDTLLDCESAINCVTIGEDRDEPAGEILVNPDDAFDCRVDSILLSLEDPTNVNYYWEKNTVVFSSDTLWVTDTGVVTVTITDTISGCTKTLEIMISSLIDYPLISIVKPDTLTCLQEEITIDASSSQSGPNIIHQWYNSNDQVIPGAISRRLDVTQPGEYYFESFDTLTGCLNRDTISVGENKFFHVADAGQDEIIQCDSNTVILNGGNSTVRNNITYLWRGLGSGSVVNGNGTLFPEVNGGGEFELIVRDDITGCTSRDTVAVEKVFAPSIDFLTVKGERCGGDELGLIDIKGISGIRPFTYELNGREVETTRFDSLRPGLFFFRVTDSLGCQTDTLLEIDEGNYLDFEIQGDTFIIKGDSTVLNVDINLPDDQVDQVYWSQEGSVFCFRCYQITVKPDTTTTYSFRLIDINGCEIEFDFVVKVQDENQIFVPNIFTPNEDTENEVLHVFGKNLVRIDRIMIFNRWGEMVCQEFNLPPGPVWDGKWNGDSHVPAVLTYVIDAVFKDGEKKQFTGSVTLMR